MGGIYSRAWYMEEEERLRKCKRSGSKVWGENEYKSKKVREVRDGRRKELLRQWTWFLVIFFSFIFIAKYWAQETILFYT